jgi:MinD-like ATPase involved in chromosome partitioning or flagellar assembly
MRILVVDTRRLREIACPPPQLRLLCQPVDENLYEFLGDSGSHPLGARSWQGDWEYRRDCLAALRRHFDFILLDTPALNLGRDLFSVAPLVDGVLLVVEAGATRVDRILHAERSIHFARGKLLGHILNKRSFTVPHWLYKRL